MVDEGERAPEFTAPLAGGDGYDDVEEFTLSDALGDGPVVLAFYPAAFTGGCTAEMRAFRDSMDAFEELDARVYGVSVDLPFAQNVWMMEHDLNFPMISDHTNDIIRDYGVVDDDLYGMVEAARRSVFVIDEDGTVAYKWVRAGDNPDFDAFVAELRDEVERVVRA